MDKNVIHLTLFLMRGGIPTISLECGSLMCMPGTMWLLRTGHTMLCHFPDTCRTFILRMLPCRIQLPQCQTSNHLKGTCVDMLLDRPSWGQPLGHHRPFTRQWMKYCQDVSVPKYSLHPQLIGSCQLRPQTLVAEMSHPRWVLPEFLSHTVCEFNKLIVVLCH